MVVHDLQQVVVVAVVVVVLVLDHVKKIVDDNTENNPYLTYKYLLCFLCKK
jgi:hypothetical protein